MLIFKIKKIKSFLVIYFFIYFLENHYAVAFQGGGAKGIAYVGVYKALLLNTLRPIKTIIGSSAGGIFALAVSTGILPY
jgi:predicted acylesterase/phospholipase RssA